MAPAPVFESILMVCVGNICRSPMAACVLSDRLARRGIAASVGSAGLAAVVGAPADPLARELMASRGLDLGGHRARQLTADLAEAHPLILVMERDHRRELEASFPLVRGRVETLGRWGGFDVPDPYLRGRRAFEAALALIDRGIDDLERACWPSSG